MSRRADPQKEIRCLAQGGNVFMVRELARSVDVNRCKDSAGFSPLHLAAMAGRLEVCRMLVEDLGADVDIRNNDGQTPLHIAAIHNRDKVRLNWSCISVLYLNIYSFEGCAFLGIKWS